MKAIKCLVLTVLLTFSTTQKSHAIASVVMAVNGVPTAGSVALTGLGIGAGGLTLAVTQVVCYEWNCLTLAFLSLVVGGLVLDEQTSALSFSSLSNEQSIDLGLTTEEMNMYNTELDEVNAVFEEVIINLEADSKIEEARLLWNEYKDFLSPKTFKVMQTIISR